VIGLFQAYVKAAHLWSVFEGSKSETEIPEHSGTTRLSFPPQELPSKICCWPVCNLILKIVIAVLNVWLKFYSELIEYISLPVYTNRHLIVNGFNQVTEHNLYREKNLFTFL